jgi:hypothetical protein
LIVYGAFDFAMISFDFIIQREQATLFAINGKLAGVWIQGDSGLRFQWWRRAFLDVTPVSRITHFEQER